MFDRSWGSIWPIDINIKLKAIIKRIVPDTDEDITELRRIKEKRLSTEKCLEICAQLSSYIEQIQSTLNQDARPLGSTELGALPERVVNEGVQGCKESINLASAKLQRNLRDTIDCLIRKSKTAMTSKDGITELTRMWDEWEAASKCKEFLSKAENYLNENISTIENYTAGNSVQYMLSTDGTVIRGKNQDNGGGSIPFRGYIGSAALQAMVRSMPRIGVGPSRNECLPLKGNIPPTQANTVDKGGVSKFNDWYGRGIKLSLGSTSDTSDPSICLVESRLVKSPKS